MERWERRSSSCYQQKITLSLFLWEAKRKQSAIKAELTKGLKDPLELYDFFLETHHNSSKEKLLEFLKRSSDYDLLKDKSQKELAEIYCERLVYSIMREGSKKKDDRHD